MEEISSAPELGKVSGALCVYTKSEQKQELMCACPLLIARSVVVRWSFFSTGCLVRALALLIVVRSSPAAREAVFFVCLEFYLA